MKLSNYLIKKPATYVLFQKTYAHSRVCDNVTDTQKISLMDVLIPAGTLTDGVTLKITHYWQFPLGNSATKNLFLAFDDSINTLSTFFAGTVNAGKAYSGVQEIYLSGNNVIAPNQQSGSGQSSNPPIILNTKDFSRDRILKLFCYWVSNQPAGTDSINISHVKVEVIK